MDADVPFMKQELLSAYYALPWQQNVSNCLQMRNDVMLQLLYIHVFMYLSFHLRGERLCGGCRQWVCAGGESALRSTKLPDSRLSEYKKKKNVTGMLKTVTKIYEIRRESHDYRLTRFRFYVNTYRILYDYCTDVSAVHCSAAVYHLTTDI